MTNTNKTFFEHIKDCENPSNFMYAKSLGYSLYKVFYNEDRTEKQYLFVKPNGEWWQTDSNIYVYNELHFNAFGQK